MSQQPAFGPVTGPPVGEISRRSFMRRMLGVGVGVLSLQFLGGTFAFLWPNLTEGLGADITLGTADDVLSQTGGALVMLGWVGIAASVAAASLRRDVT